MRGIHVFRNSKRQVILRHEESFSGEGRIVL